MPRHAIALVAACVLQFRPAPTRAQHEGHGEQRHESHGEHAPPEGHGAHDPESPRSLFDLETARNASGTAWQPELTPHAGYHHMGQKWQLMAHALLFAGYDYQASDRGDGEFVGLGWVMGMATRRLGSGGLTARLMLSPEAWTASQSGGYPLLLQTGETYQGQPLHDQQHPHDLFMEVGLIYTQPLGDSVGVQLYVAPAGEPALGPVAFPHRQSAASDPLAAIVHHWQDSTHVSFGVLTAGVFTRWGKLEGSWFNGREPDEQRTDLDLQRPNSYAVRASVAPSPAWSGQLSYGYLSDHHAMYPGVAVHKVTASAMYHRPLAAGHWASTAVFGLNKHAGGHHEDPGSSFLLESDLALDRENTVFGRAEVVQKTGEDLVLPASLHHSSFTLASLAAGYVRNFPPFAGLVAGLGLRAALGLVPASLRPTYGTRTLVGGMLYLRLAPAPPTAAHEHESVPE